MSNTKWYISNTGTGYHSDHVCRALCCRGELDHSMYFDTAPLNDEVFGKELHTTQTIVLVWDEKKQIYETLDGNTGLQTNE